MINTTEKKIMKDWDIELYSEPFVTIVCLAYNHENFIKDAIEGFLNQKTTFPFKVFVHDDCSIDNTSDIVRRYEKKFPNIIEAVYEKENLYSKGFSKIQNVIRNHVCGKYEALCEGDDYWIDPYKLQKQVEYLENNKNCALVFSNGKIFNVAKNSYFPVFLEEEMEYAKDDKIITLDNFYRLKFPPTASYVFRTDYVKNINTEMPDCVAQDIRTRLYLLTKGYAYYFKDVMCVYRMEVPNSETTKWKRYDKKSQKEASMSYINVLERVNEITNYKYSRSIWKMKTLYLQNIISNSSSLLVFTNSEYRKAYGELSIRRKIKVIIKLLIPNFLYKIYLRNKHGN